MSRLCGSTATRSGIPCAQIVADGNDHCESGHPCVPATRPVARLAPSLGTSLDVDDLAGRRSPTGPSGTDLERQARSAPDGAPRRSASTRRLRAISARLPRLLVTLDMDGTCYDPWACCGRRDESFVGSAKCRHVRSDTLDAAREVAERTGAGLVVLSWRPRGDRATREWLAAVGGLEVVAVFVPGGLDDVCEYPGTHKSAAGQVGFKTQTVTTLRSLGHEVVASFDDRRVVCDALRAAGVPDVRLVSHLVEIEPHEYAAGYLGAPKTPPRPKGAPAADAAGGDWWLTGEGSLLDRHREAFPDRHGPGARQGRGRLDRRLFPVDPYDPSYDPDELAEMSEILDDPDAPPVRLHELVEADPYFSQHDMEEVPPLARPRRSPSRD